MKTCIIYYVHGTLSNKNIRMSSYYLGVSLRYARDHLAWGEGWAGELFEPPTVVLVDSGFDGGYNTKVVKDTLSRALDHEYEIEIYVPPKTKSVAADIQWQIASITEADWYICLKADFIIPQKFMYEFFDYAHHNPGKAIFMNCAKFDLRESVNQVILESLTKINSWRLTAQLPGGCPHYNVPDWGDHKLYVGYDGIDGCFHFYSESAREKLTFPHFINQWTWDRNKELGVEMFHGHDKFYGLHVWHDIPRPDPKKGKIGHRF